MKTFLSAYAAHNAQAETTLCECIRIVRRDSLVVARTSSDKELTVDAVLYTPGFNASSIVTSAGLAVGNLDLTTLDDGSAFERGEVLGGLWRNAAFEIFRVNYLSPTDGKDPLLSGTFGQVELRQNTIVCELRDLRQYLQQPVGHVSQRTCPYSFGDSLCTIDLAPITVTGSVTGVTSRRVFRNSAVGSPAFALDYFGNGSVTWLTGDNAGVEQQVLEYAADGTFTLVQSLLHDIQIGDTYSAVPGCRKRWEEDCKGKWANLLNFGGDKDSPGVDDLSQAPA